MSRLNRKHATCEQFLFPCALVALLAGCATAATFEAMVPAAFETARKHPYTIRVIVTGGQESEAVGRPQIPNSAFARALIDSITKSRTFSKVVEGQITGENYLLTVTLFSMDKRVFGRTVRLEAGWTLRRGDTGAIVWQESIITEYTDFNVQAATEGAARNNIAQALGEISRQNLE